MSISNKKNILIIDNDNSQHTNLTHTLSTLYELHFFKTGQEAISYYKNSTTAIDLILLSVDMNDMPPLDIYKHCYEQSEKTVPPIILSIPHHFSGDWITPFNVIQDFYSIEKPFIKEELLTTIQHALLKASLIQNQPSTSFRPPLNSLLIKYNTHIISKKRAQFSPNQPQPSDIKSDLLYFEDIVNHPEGLGFIVDTLEKETGQQVPSSETQTLLVEDEVSISELTEEYFEKNKQPLVVARTLSEAILCLKEHANIDVIILDLNLPDGQGFPLLTAIQNHCTPLHHDSVFKCLSLPDIIIVSAYTDKAIVNQCIHAGANSYINKPLSLVELYNTVKKLSLRRRRLHAIETLCRKL